MPEPGALRTFSEYLRNPVLETLSPEERQELTFKGIVAALEEAAVQEAHSSDAIHILYETAASHASENIRSQAFHALARLAQEGYSQAIDDIYLLAIEGNLLAARQVILSGKWEPSSAALKALFVWSTCLAAAAPFPVEHLSSITTAYFQLASADLQQRLLASAETIQMANWAIIAGSLQDDNNRSMQRLVNEYPSFSEPERQLTLVQLEQRARHGSKPAQEALCRLFTTYGDNEAKKIVMQEGFLPEDIQERALLYFLAEDWQAYSSLDFNHNLLVNVYETSGRPMRRQLLEHSRKTGQTEWLLRLGAAGEVRWPNDLADADWELAINRLAQGMKLDDLWRLSQAAPPLWSARILAYLAETGWAPEKGDESSGYVKLVAMARQCLQSPLIIHPKKLLDTGSADITCMAIHPGGKLLGAGSSDQRIHLLSLPKGNQVNRPLISPVPVTRVLAFGPEGELIAAASGDNRIRVFNYHTGQLVKTLEGHQAMIRSLAIHPNGRMLFSAGFDGQIHFWRFPSGADLKVIEPKSGEIFSLVTGNEGKNLVTGGIDGEIRVYAISTGALVNQFSGHAGAVTHLAASTYSDRIASAGNDGMINIWNSRSAGLVHAMHNRAGPVTCLYLHPDDQVLITGHQNGQINLWNISSGEAFDPLPGHQQAVNGLALTGDGQKLYTSDAMGKIFAWDLSSFLTIHLAGQASVPGSILDLQERLKDSHLLASEKSWLAFSLELARWRQRFEIELSEWEPIQIGEFDIELFS